jgi:hypothetical protein
MTAFFFGAGLMTTFLCLGAGFIFGNAALFMPGIALGGVGVYDPTPPPTSTGLI